MNDQQAWEIIEGLDDDAREEIADALGLAEIELGDLSGLTYTRDSLDDFRTARRNWREPGEVVADTDSILDIRRAQPRRGDPRRDVAVIDLGDFRAVAH